MKSCNLSTGWPTFPILSSFLSSGVFGNDGSGDQVNGDGVTDISDVIDLGSLILEGSLVICPNSAELNGDGVLSVIDFVTLANIITFG